MNTLLITGGTGFIGNKLVRRLLKDDNPKKIISFSRRWAASEKLVREVNDPRLRVINGDVADYDTLHSALKGVDYVIHAAAYKSVPSAEYNPFEAKRVNVDGSENLIKACIANDVKKVLLISSDKASSAANLYGRTKALMESMALSANNLGNTRFAVARYGNVVGSTGSVIPFFCKILESEQVNPVFPVTKLSMTRYWFHPDEAAEYVLRCLWECSGGEIYVPKLKSSSISVLITAIMLACKDVDINIHENVEIIGLRPGEKLHEEMISIDESSRTKDLEWTYVICPFKVDWNESWFDKYNIYSYVDFERFTSFNAPRMSIEELKQIVAVCN